MADKRCRMPKSWSWYCAEDIRWEGEDPGISRKGSRPGPGRGNKKSMTRGGAVAGAGRGRGLIKGPSKKDFLQSQNGMQQKVQHSGQPKILAN